MEAFFEKCRWFNIQLTTAFGITTIVHWTTLLVFCMIFLFSPLQAAIFAIAFLSIVPHEYGHVLAARYYGLKTDKIILYPVGGVALILPNKDIKIEGWKEIVIAAAGPLVTLSLVFIGVIASCFTALPPEPKITDLTFWHWLSVINIILFVFNMIPAFPMDGGRILRGFINLFTDHVTSTKYAFFVSVLLCLVIGILGLLSGNIMLAITMFLIYYFAESEYIYTRSKKEKSLEKINEGIT